MVPVTAARFGIEVVPAAGLGIGDQTLAGESVRVRICGLYPGVPGAKAATVDAVTLWVLFPSPDPELPEPLPFLAWSYDRRPENVAAPLSFTLPLEIDGGLELSLSVVSRRDRRPSRTPAGPGAGRQRRSSAAVARQFATRFTVDWERGLPRLQRGIFLLGLAPRHLGPAGGSAGAGGAAASRPAVAGRRRRADRSRVATLVAVGVEPSAVRAVQRPSFPGWPPMSRAAHVTFRPIRPEDQEFLCRLYASIREEELAPVPTGAPRRRWPSSACSSRLSTSTTSGTTRTAGSTWSSTRRASRSGGSTSRSGRASSG